MLRGPACRSLGDFGSRLLRSWPMHYHMFFLKASHGEKELSHPVQNLLMVLSDKTVISVGCGRRGWGTVCASMLASMRDATDDNDALDGVRRCAFLSFAHSDFVRC